MAKNNENTGMLKAEDPNAPDAPNPAVEPISTQNTTDTSVAKSTSGGSVPEEGMLDVEAVILEAETRCKTALAKMKDLAGRLEVDVSHEFADIEKTLKLLAG